jgi:DNA repair protein NreA
VSTQARWAKREAHRAIRINTRLHSQYGLTSPLPYKQHCIFCKSAYHTYRNCSLAFKMKSVKLMNEQAKQEYAGESPNVFVGQYGYPRVNVGFLNVERYTEQDEPLKWSKENKQIPEIVDLRTSLINSTFQQHIKGFNDRLLRMGQEVGMASKPAEMELKLAKKPRFSTQFELDAQPHGPNVRLEQARLTENVKVDTRVERVVDDADLKSAPALDKLYKKGFDEHFLTKLFSVGNLGVAAQRRLVPTRWSITAVDDTLGKELIRELKDFPESDCRVHIGGYLGNEYVILFFDDVWAYELFEGYVPLLLQNGDVAWDTDYENYNGRTEYAQNTVGGYYAARLSILERLRMQKRQSSVLALRFVTTEYSTPLGVWVVREAVRKAMAAVPLGFSDREQMKRYVIDYCKKRFSYDVTDMIERRSRLVKNMKTQTRLGRWL